MSIWPQAMSYLRPSSAVRLGQPGDRVLGRGVGRGVRARRVGRDRAVVDDAPAARVLALHHPEGLLRAQERAGQVDVDHRASIARRSSSSIGTAGALTPALLNSRSSRPKAPSPPRTGPTDAGSPTSAATRAPPAEPLAFARDLCKRRRAAAGEGDVPAGRGERQRRSPADAATAAGDQREFVLSHSASQRDRSDLIRERRRPSLSLDDAPATQPCELRTPSSRGCGAERRSPRPTCSPKRTNGSRCCAAPC